MNLKAIFFFLSGVAWASECDNVQLGSTQPCEYSTSNCTNGVIQWNYPTHTCLWTFAPKGASSVALRATWRTAAEVNVSFYDGPGPTAKKLLEVFGGESDDAAADLVSQTGTVFVRLEGPPTMMTYALIFDYTLLINPPRCALYNGNNNCEACLNAGCSMTNDGGCVNTCPADGSTCWPPGSGSPTLNQATCAQRKSFLDLRATCETRGTCESCLEGGQCKWGGPVDSPVGCHAMCEGRQRCKFLDVCPTADLCSNQTTCEGCIKVGCSVLGIDNVNCVPECPMDVPCFKVSCRDRQSLIDKHALCGSLNDNCSSCMEQGCVWNKIGGEGEKCIPYCGVFPCDPAPQCDSAPTLRTLWTMIVSIGYFLS